MIGVDSNVIVRYVAQDDARQAALATRFLETEVTPAKPGFVSLVVVAEVAWVLESCYDADRATLATTVEALLSAPQLRIQDAESVWTALHEFRNSSAGFSDTLIARLAATAGCTESVTFDKHASRHAGFRILK